MSCRLNLIFYNEIPTFVIIIMILYLTLFLIIIYVLFYSIDRNQAITKTKIIRMQGICFFSVILKSIWINNNVYPCILYHNKFTSKIGAYNLSMKFLTGKLHTAVGMMTVHVCGITVTQRLAVLSICRMYTRGNTVYSSKSTFTR